MKAFASAGRPQYRHRSFSLPVVGQEELARWRQYMARTVQIFMSFTIVLRLLTVHITYRAVSHDSVRRGPCDGWWSPLSISVRRLDDLARAATNGLCGLGGVVPGGNTAPKDGGTRISLTGMGTSSRSRWMHSRQRRASDSSLMLDWIRANRVRVDPWPRARALTKVIGISTERSEGRKTNDEMGG